MIGKRGAALTVYIIGIVVLVASVVAIFFIISQVDFTEDIDKQACKQSVVLRSSLNFGALKATEAIDLECKTKKICLTASGDDCAEVSSTEDNPVEKIKIPGCNIERRAGVNLDPPEAEFIDKSGFDIAGAKGVIITEEVRIEDRWFEPLGDGEGYVRVVEGGGIFHVRNVRIVTKERIEIIVPNVDTYVLFNKHNHGYTRYIEIIGQRSNPNIKDVVISGQEFELENDRNNPLKFTLNEEGKLVAPYEEEGGLVEACSQTRREIMKVFADQMVRCHDMIGEGKLNFIGEDSTEQENYGLVCNRIVFDEELKRLPMRPIGFLEFYSYLTTRQVGGQTDFEYLYPGVDGVQGLVRDYQHYVGNEDNVVVPPDPSEWTLDLDQRNGYGIIANIAPKGQWESVAALVGLSAAGVVATAIGGPVGLSIFGGIASGGVSYWYLYDEGYAYSPPTIVPFTFDTLRELNVYDFEVAP